MKDEEYKDFDGQLVTLFDTVAFILPDKPKSFCRGKVVGYLNNQKLTVRYKNEHGCNKHLMVKAQNVIKVLTSSE